MWRRGMIDWTITMSVFMALIFIGCYYNADGTISVRNNIVDVGSVVVGDSACAMFCFRNNTAADVILTFMPECDCTTVSAETMQLGHYRRGRMEVKVAVEAPGEFRKYMYVQVEGSDDFILVAIKGYAK